MTEDTKNAVEEIKRKRWYVAYMTLGVDGWSAVRQFSRDWKSYRLTPDDGSSPRDIRAADDAAAWAAYDTFYRPGGRVVEVFTQHREVRRPGDTSITAPPANDVALDRYPFERKMQILCDLKKSTAYDKSTGKWYWHDRDEPNERHGPFDAFTAAVDDAVAPYVAAEDD